MYHYARIVDSFDNRKQVFHFVAVEGTNDWVSVKLNQPLQPEHEQYVRKLVAGHLSDKYTCQTCKRRSDDLPVEHAPDCDNHNVMGFRPMRVTKGFLRRCGADFVTIG